MPRGALRTGRASPTLLSGGAADGIAATLRVHRHNCGRTPPHTFLGNHDVARLADATPAPLLPAAFCLLMTLPGIPIRQFGHLRRANPWLTSATLTDVHVQHGGLTCTTTDGIRSLHVCVNPTAAPVTLDTRSAGRVEVAPRGRVVRPA